MTLTFVSNYINHHQLPVAGYMYDKLGDGYHFIQTEEVEEERVSLGWQADFDLPYLVKSYEDEDRARELIANSDIVLMDDCVSEDYINDRIEAGKIVIRLAERCYKEGQWKAISPRGLIYKNKVHTKRADKPVYLMIMKYSKPTEARDISGDIFLSSGNVPMTKMTVSLIFSGPED